MVIILGFCSVLSICFPRSYVSQLVLKKESSWILANPCPMCVSFPANGRYWVHVGIDEWSKPKTWWVQVVHNSNGHNVNELEKGNRQSSLYRFKKYNSLDTRQTFNVLLVQAWVSSLVSVCGFDILNFVWWFGDFPVVLVVVVYTESHPWISASGDVKILKVYRKAVCACGVRRFQYCYVPVVWSAVTLIADIHRSWKTYFPSYDTACVLILWYRFGI